MNNFEKPEDTESVKGSSEISNTMHLEDFADKVLGHLDSKSEEDKETLNKIRESLKSDSKGAEVIARSLENFMLSLDDLIKFKGIFSGIVDNLDAHNEAELNSGFSQCQNLLNNMALRLVDTDSELARQINQLYGTVNTLRGFCLKRENRLYQTWGAKMLNKIPLFRSPTEVNDRANIREVREVIKREVGDIEANLQKQINNRK